MIKVVDARFVTTAVDERGAPKDGIPEVAFVGRSNVGKSSMINTLTQRRKLVRVSNTPGRTRTLNFFDAVVERRGKRHTVRFADLPGYGFAKVSKAERESWSEMIEGYLSRRAPLKVVVAIIDAEVGPTADDHEMLAWLQERTPKILVAATKIDRLNKARRKPRLVELSKQLELPLETILPFSATERIGVDELWGTLLDVLR
ncbi:MAG: YihA family ribosome biogenesis GTP-binding protein [Myxococcaceae bacterium]|nr:YihA family ribosome biogenesis GTP-binding protein [Myxococcaceae bacterium]